MKYKMVFIEAKIFEVAKQEITKSKFFFTIFLFNDIIKYFQKKLIPYVTLKIHIIQSAYLYGK